MVHPGDVLCSALAVYGSRALKGLRPPTAVVEEVVRAGLERDDGRLATVRFFPGDLPFSGWIDALRGEGAGPIRLIVQPPPPAPPGMTAAVAHAAVGMSPITIGVVRRRRIRPYGIRMLFPRRSLVGLKDLVEFIEASPKREKMKEFLLWQNRHNLKFSRGNDWDRFLRSVTDDRIEVLMDAWRMCLSNVEWKRGEPEAWQKVERRHPNPEQMPRVEFHEGEEVAGSPVDGVEARAESLAAALREIEAYARKADLGGFADHFARCRETIGGADPSGGLARLFAGMLSPAAVGLFVAAVESDVFGGMGSWNDVSSYDDPEYRDVSDRLFRALQPALLAAVNSGSGA
jgi:hypothetical protein